MEDLNSEKYSKQHSKQHSVVFKGQTGAYFKLWFTNLFFIIITLGMYLPWAIVKARKYFYSNTEINEYHFDYHGKGKDIFIGLLLFFVALVLVFVGMVINQIVGDILYCLLLLSLPWILISACRYNMKMTSFNNIRFGFEGKILKGYWVLLIAPILILIVCYLLLVIVFDLSELDVFSIISGVMAGFMQMELFVLMTYLLLISSFSIITMMGWYYWINHSLFNQQNFRAKFNFMSILKINGIAVLLALLFIVLGLTPMYLDSLEPRPVYVGPYRLFEAYLYMAIMCLSIIVAMVVAGCYLTAANFKMIAKSTQLGDVRFASSMSFLSLLWITISNLLMIIFTLGLMTPFARIRMARYFAQSTSVIGDIKF